MSRKLIIGTDFDGTLVEHEYPNIGAPLPWAFETLRVLKKKGYRLMLWSMRGHPDLERFPHLDIRTGEYIPIDTLQEAVDFCRDQGVEFDGVNESPEQFSTSAKQYAHIYIDDTALGCPLVAPRKVDWIEVIKLLISAGCLSLEDCGEIFNVDTYDAVYDNLGIYHGHTGYPGYVPKLIPKTN